MSKKNGCCVNVVFNFEGSPYVNTLCIPMSFDVISRFQINKTPFMITKIPKNPKSEEPVDLSVYVGKEAKIYLPPYKAQTIKVLNVQILFKDTLTVPKPKFLLFEYEYTPLSIKTPNPLSLRDPIDSSLFKLPTEPAENTKYGFGNILNPTSFSLNKKGVIYDIECEFIEPMIGGFIAVVKDEAMYKELIDNTADSTITTPPFVSKRYNIVAKDDKKKKITIDFFRL